MINNFLHNIFLKHPEENNVNYFQHFIISINISKSFFVSSIQALIHAFIPSLFTTSSQDCIKEITVFMKDVYL